MDRTPYRAAVRLYGLAEFYWSQIDADYIHVDLLGLPAHRLMNVLHTWFYRKIEDPEEREMFDTRLNEPFEWEKREKVVIHSTGDDELAMMRQAMAGG